jgi:hypothetical protein
MSHLGVTLVFVPTSYPRRSISETPPVREALDALRRRGERFRLSDLIIRGVSDRLREIDAGEDDEALKAELRRQLVAQLHTGEGLDAQAAYEVRDTGWTH